MECWCCMVLKIRKTEDFSVIIGNREPGIRKTDRCGGENSNSRRYSSQQWRLELVIWLLSQALGFDLLLLYLREDE